jgi:hypothetical protein
MHTQPRDDHEQPTKGVQVGTLSENDYALSLMIALTTGARFGYCYQNAYPAFFAFPQLFNPHGLFVEGWIVFEDQGRVVLMEHGWLVSNRKHLVDPTIVLALDYGQPLYYFPGVFRSWQETDALDNELFPHVRFSDYGADGMGHPGYREAYETAWHKAHSLLTPAKEFIEVRASEVSADSRSREEAAVPAAVVVMAAPQDRERGEGHEE